MLVVTRFTSSLSQVEVDGAKGGNDDPQISSRTYLYCETAIGCRFSQAGAEEFSDEKQQQQTCKYGLLKVIF